MGATNPNPTDAAPERDAWGPALRLFGVGSASLQDRLAALAEQRALLIALRGELHGAIRSLAALDPATRWCSAAQRRYSGRLADLQEGFGRSARHVDSAVEAVEMVERALALTVAHPPAPEATDPAAR